MEEKNGKEKEWKEWKSGTAGEEVLWERMRGKNASEEKGEGMGRRKRKNGRERTRMDVMRRRGGGKKEDERKGKE